MNPELSAWEIHGSNRTSTRGSGVRYGALAVGSCGAGPGEARW
jgi:hypothetical protein